MPVNCSANMTMGWLSSKCSLYPSEAHISRRKARAGTVSVDLAKAKEDCRGRWAAVLFSIEGDGR